MIDTSNGSAVPSRTMVMMISEPDRPAHHFDRLVQRQAAGRFRRSTWVMKSPAWIPASAAGRAVHRRDDLDEALFLGDLDPEAAEFAAGLHLHVVEVLRRQVAGMRVERGEHAVDRGLDQFVGRRPLRHTARGSARRCRRTGRAVRRPSFPVRLPVRSAGRRSGLSPARPATVPPRAAITNFFMSCQSPVRSQSANHGAGSTGSAPCLSSI